MEGGFRVPCIVRWPGKVPAGKVENGLMSGLDWFPTFVAAAGNPNIVGELKKGKQLGERTYKVISTATTSSTSSPARGRRSGTRSGTSPKGRSARCASTTTSTASSTSPEGWLGGTVKPDWPILTNIRLDPFERTGCPKRDQGRVPRIS